MPHQQPVIHNIGVYRQFSITYTWARRDDVTGWVSRIGQWWSGRA